MRLLIWTNKWTNTTNAGIVSHTKIVMTIIEKTESYILLEKIQIKYTTCSHFVQLKNRKYGKHIKKNKTKWTEPTN